MFLKRAVGKVLLRMHQRARAEEMEQIRERGLRQSSVGKGSVIEFSRIAWRARARLVVGNNSMFVGTCVFEREEADVQIGARTYVAGMISCASRVLIGDDVLVAGGGYIADHASHALVFEKRRRDVLDWCLGNKDWSNVEIEPVTIRDRSWIGFNVIILKGITIGEGAVVGAGSVVTRDVDPFTIVAGNPARLIRKLGVI